MGCIQSNRKESGDNFRIRAVQIVPESCSGYLELTSRELIFTKGDSNNGSSGQCTVWALQHLRRYGMREDFFSFEAGRRCMSGQGIYTFRCPNHAERLYQLFQRSLRNTDALNCTIPPSGVGIVTGSNPGTNIANNYLDPAPLNAANAATMAAFRTTLRDSFSSSPLSLELDSPDSVPSLSFTNEVVHFQSQQTQARSVYGNVYLEQPFRPQHVHGSAAERNNNTSNGTSNFITEPSTTGISSAYDTPLNTKSMITTTTTAGGDCSSPTGPPEECAPILSPAQQQTEAIHMHMYANVDNLGNHKAASFLRDKCPIDPAERCYENLSRADLPLLLHSTTTTGISSCKVMISERSGGISSQPSTPCTVTTPTTPQVNYIVLDLDQPRSPTQFSPKAFGSGLSLLTGGTATERNSDAVHSLPNTMSMTLPSMKGHHAHGHGMSVSMTTAAKLNEARDDKAPTTESSLGYSTIDFIKTCALIKSANGRAGDGGADHEESRITRHSKCVRKAYSINVPNTYMYCKPKEGAIIVT